MCLTDPAAKKVYDADLPGASPAVAEVEPGDDEPEAPLELVAPAPQRPQAQTEIPVAAAPSLLAPAAVLAPAGGGQDRLDEAAAAAQASPAARRGLGTKRALYQRLARTRQLAAAWEQSGKYLAWPKRRLTRPAEATEIIQLLTTVRTLLRGFPLMGEAGQPGYLVVALARQQVIVPTFQTLLASQREALARDWWAGRTVLTAHREFLRQELRAQRKRSLLGRWFRAARVFVAEQPGGVLLLLALLALNVAIWRTFVFPEWFERPAPTAPATAPEEP
jgi:hypothetical protein